MNSGHGNRRLIAALIAAVAVAAAGLPALAAGASAPVGSRAGVAVVDTTWHVGAAQGQYADTVDPSADDVDPYRHHTIKEKSVGLGSRITARALVTEDTSGNRIALVTNDLYLSQDLLNRRVTSLLAEHDRLVLLGQRPGPATGITGSTLAITSSHSHSSPYASSSAWGAWVFQDVLDLRFFEYMATKMADAVIAAASSMVPVRMGAATIPFNEITSHSYGPQVADDGTPAGAPWSHSTGQLSVVHFDDVTDPANPAPLANWVVMGLHPEWVWGDGYVTGDIATAMQRTVDRELGGVTLWSQRETGTSGPHKDTRVHPPEARREFQDMKFAQLDRAGRMFADAVASAVGAIGSPGPDVVAHVGWSSDFAVGMTSQRFAPPATRPYPGVSNCTTRKAFDGDPGVPIVGVPDCGFFFGDVTRPVLNELPVTPGQLHDQLAAAGVPIPASYSGPALTGLEETAAVHLQAIRLGDIAITLCPCEQFTDQALNIASRLDRVPGNLYLGFDWTPTCTQQADTSWTCPDPRGGNRPALAFDDQRMQRLRARLFNDARGWEDPAYAPYAESEPVDPALIKGNYTHEELTAQGFGMVLPLAMANDYWGYIPTYREYMYGDYYRKALSGLGPHGSDFLATRLSRMAASLNGGAAVPVSALDLAYTAESGRLQAMAEGLGAAARQYTAVYEASLPVDGVDPAVQSQPADIRRFDAAELVFTGGSTYDDLPDVRVERLVDGNWEPFGDTTGEVQLQVAFPTQSQLQSWRSGQFAWEWTASFEAFVSEIPTLAGRPGTTPAGTYRFVVDGRRRSAPLPCATACGYLSAASCATACGYLSAGTVVPYHLVSQSFAVAPWDGITVEDLAVNAGAVTFRVGPTSVASFGSNGDYLVGPIDYPDSYDSSIDFIDPARSLYTYGMADRNRHQQYCRQCSFRAWADTSSVASAVVTVTRAGSGGVEQVSAVQQPDGSWSAAAALQPGDTASVRVADTFGESNGTAATITAP